MRKTLLGIWTLLTLLVYGSILISPQHFEYVGLIGFGIPILMVLNIICCFFAWISDWKAKWVLSLLVLGAWPFYGMSFQLGGNDTLDREGLKVMSYNVKWFVDATNDNYGPVIDWIRSTDSDIICFQEFYPRKNIEPRLAKGYYVSSDRKEFHTAIYSKYPILNDGLLLDDKQLNNIRFIDIKKESDTIRVYNLHLQSMGIAPQTINSAESTQNDYENVGIRFVSGSRVRSAQMEILLDHMASCDYPMIVVGDFNDVPFSNNYFKLNRKLNNAFESKGAGIGATFNDGIPFLRIDNQFYSDELELSAFKVFDDTYYSDHFPLVGIYNLTP